MDVWRRLLLAVVCGVAVASIYAAQPVLEAMGRDLGVPAELTGWIVATGQFGYLAGLVLLVPLGDVVANRRRLIAVHLAITAVGMLLTALASAAWMAFVGLAAAGLFAVVVQTTVAYAASVSPPAERGRNIGVVTSGVVVGILGARVVTGALAEVWGWRSIYAVLAVLSLGLAALVLVALPPEERPSRPAGYRQAVVSLGELFGQRLFLTRGLIAFFLFASFGTLWSGLSLPLADAPWQLSESQIGLFGIVGTRRRARRGTRGTVGGCRTGDPGHRPRAHPAHPLVGSDRAAAVDTVAPHRRNRGPRLRGPGRACEQPAPAHHRAPGSHQQRHRRLHGLLLTRLRPRRSRNHRPLHHPRLGGLQSPRGRIRGLRAGRLGDRQATAPR